VAKVAQRLRVEEDEIADAYLKAVSWCDEVFGLIPQFGAGPAANAGPARRVDTLRTGDRPRVYPFPKNQMMSTQPLLAAVDEFVDEHPELLRLSTR
jgi:hypothetical protein